MFGGEGEGEGEGAYTQEAARFFSENSIIVALEVGRVGRPCTKRLTRRLSAPGSSCLGNPLEMSHPECLQVKQAVASVYSPQKVQFIKQNL